MTSFSTDDRLNNVLGFYGCWWDTKSSEKTTHTHTHTHTHFQTVRISVVSQCWNFGLRTLLLRHTHAPTHTHTHTHTVPRWAFGGWGLISLLWGERKCLIYESERLEDLRWTHTQTHTLTFTNTHTHTRTVTIAECLNWKDLRKEEEK